MEVRVLHLSEGRWIVSRRKGNQGGGSIHRPYTSRSVTRPVGATSRRMTSSTFDVADLLAETRFPEVTVRLVGEDGNAFAILGKVEKALRRAGASPADIRSFRDDATAGDYDHLLRTVMAWVEVK